MPDQTGLHSLVYLCMCVYVCVYVCACFSCHSNFYYFYVNSKQLQHSNRQAQQGMKGDPAVKDLKNKDQKELFCSQGSHSDPMAKQ